MATVGDILRIKGTEVVSVGPDATVLEAARCMNEHGIGSVLVLEDGALVGIFTERDVLRRVVAVQRDPASTPVREVMTPRLVTCDPGTDMEACAQSMSGGRIRHLPVIAGGKLAGLVTSGDVLAYQLRDQESTIRQLHGFIYDGR
jgi:CBS domain-containing protein